MRRSIYYLVIGILIASGIAILMVVKKGGEAPPSSPQYIAPSKQERPKIVIRGTTYFVSPSGDDGRDGLSQASAFSTIQKGIETMLPGDGLILADGTYFQDFMSVRDGTKERPIIIKGSEKAVVHGSGERDKIAEIHHSYIVLNGFSIDGRGGDGSKEKQYRDKLIYAEGFEADHGITGLRILDMHLMNAGGECVRIKHFAKQNEIAYNTITRCGAYDFLFDAGGKNGEGIYIGTAPEQVQKGKDGSRSVDASDDNWIHDNTIDTQGNECVDIKEGSSGNLVENNSCTGQKDKESGGLDSRGNGNTFRKNEVFGSAGAGIRLGGDGEGDGMDNSVIENYLHHNRNGGIKIQSHPQRQICGNIITDNKKDALVGEYSEDNENKASCL
ncbi:MAG: right-handed parallel beta-helix repeat-containing protein [Candidatus Moranbacteria bacterium]|nr:right-handed parallel beta-helix repeat-containing protein [Candidatus Moranbacteria bacterium]